MLTNQEYWFHGTSVENAHKICADGKLVGKHGIYFANTIGYATAFARFHDKTKDVVVFKVPTERLEDVAKLSPGLDHDPAFYPKDLEVAWLWDEQNKNTAVDVFYDYDDIRIVRADQNV